MIFVSHSNEDNEKIVSIMNIVNRTIGNSDWFMDHINLQGGSTWRTDLLTKIEASDGILAFISNTFKTSEWCDQEIGYAIAKGKKILAVSLDNSSPYGFIREEQGVKWVENSYYNSDHHYNNEFVLSLRKLLSALLRKGLIHIESVIVSLENCSSYEDSGTLCIPLFENMQLIDSQVLNLIASVLLKANKNHFNQVTDSLQGGEALRKIFREKLGLLDSDLGNSLKERNFFEKIQAPELASRF